MKTSRSGAGASPQGVPAPAGSNQLVSNAVVPPRHDAPSSVQALRHCGGKRAVQPEVVGSTVQSGGSSCIGEHRPAVAGDDGAPAFDRRRSKSAKGQCQPHSLSLDRLRLRGERAHARTHARTRTCTHVRTRACMHSCARVCPRAHALVHLRACAPTCP
eukprot:4795142-Alexandrium_andersonii.AAC.1